MVIGLMIAGILSGLVSAVVAIATGHSLMIALLAYALGGFVTAVGTILVMAVRIGPDPALSPEFGTQIAQSDARHP